MQNVINLFDKNYFQKSTPETSHLSNKKLYTLYNTLYFFVKKFTLIPGVNIPYIPNI